MKFTEKDLGNYVVDEEGLLWRVITLSYHPSVDVELVDADPCRECGRKKRKGFAQGSPVSEQFTRLVKEK